MVSALIVSFFLAAGRLRLVVADGFLAGLALVPAPVAFFAVDFFLGLALVVAVVVVVSPVVVLVAPAVGAPAAAAAGAGASAPAEAEGGAEDPGSLEDIFVYFPG